MKQSYQWAEKMTPVELSALIDNTVINAGESIIRMRRAVKANNFKTICEESNYLTRIAERFGLAALGENAEKVGTACLSEDTEEVTTTVRNLVIDSNRELIGLFENKISNPGLRVN